MKQIYAFLFLMISGLYAETFAQTLVNKQFSSLTGFPNISYDYQTSAKDDDGNVIVIGNTFTPGQEENYLITKYKIDGQKSWEYEFNGWTELTDFGTAVTIFKTDIFVCGVSYDTVLNASSFEILKLDKNGTLLWHERYAYQSYELSNVPLAICADDKGDIYVAGTSQTDVADYALIVLKYAGDGTGLIWEYSYDSLGIYDGAGGIKHIISGGNRRIVIYGASGSATTDFDFLTININATTGKQSDFSRIKNTNAYFAKPVEIVKDKNNNVYTLGNYLAGINNIDIKLIKLDTLLNVVWIKTFDGGVSLNDEASALKIDSLNNIYIAGSAMTALGKQEAWLMKLDNAGNIVWDRRRKSINGLGANGKKIEFDKNKNILFVGRVHNGSDYSFLTQSYDSLGKLRWEKTFDTDSTKDDEAQSVVINRYNQIVVSGRSLEKGGLWRYYNVFYVELEKPKDIVTNGNSEPVYMDNQLIVKFRKDMVNTSFTDNVDLQFASMGEVLQPWALDTLNERYGYLFNTNTQVEKIYKTLKSTYSYSIARNGDTIKIPDFWASMLVYVPKPAARSVINVKDTLNSMFPLIEYANLNLIATLQSNCNTFDSLNNYNRWNDPAMGNQGDGQKGLINPLGGIAADSAWCYEQGKPFVKVGIYDSGLDLYHDDFGGNRASFSYDTSKVGGWDFINNFQLGTNTYSVDNYTSHGTGISGVVGAIRNNLTDIAGIAGGDFQQNNSGVKLFGMQIFFDISSNLSDINVATLSNLLNAYIVGGSDIPTASFGYGFHITNHSYLFGINDLDTISNNYDFTSNEVLELKRAVNYLFKNQVVFNVSAGNDISTPAYPNSLNNDWVIVTTTTSRNGNVYEKNTVNGDPDWKPLESSVIDLAAPGASGETISTICGGGFGTQNSYIKFRKTSFSNAFTTGVASLLKSYHDTILSNPKNLSPEDVEQILTRAAVDIGPAGKDTLSGWGRLNAARALRYIDKDCRKVVHFGVLPTNSNLFSSVTSTALILNDQTGPSIILQPLKLSERYQNRVGVMIDTTQKFAIVSKITKNCIIPVPLNNKIVAVWPRHSNSTAAGIYDSTTNVLNPYDKISITFSSPNNVEMVGYLYELSDTNAILPLRSVFIGGEDTISGTGGFNFAKMELTILFEDTVNKCNVVLPTSITQISENVSCSLYPNPTENLALLQIYTSNYQQINITLADVTGKLILNKTEEVNGVKSISIDVSNLTVGMYVLNIKSENISKTFKISKQ